MKDIQALLKITKSETELFTKVQGLLDLIVSIKDKEFKKELLLKLNLLDFLQANIAWDLPDRESIKEMPSQAVTKFYTIINSEKFCFYFSCLFAYKKFNLKLIDEIPKDKMDEDEKLQIKNIISSFINHADEYSYNALEFKKTYKMEGLILVLLCCNKIKAYENILLTQTIGNNNIPLIASSYYKSLREKCSSKYYTLPDLRELLLPKLESAIAEVKVKMESYRRIADEWERGRKSCGKLSPCIFLFCLVFEVVLINELFVKAQQGGYEYEQAKSTLKGMSFFLLMTFGFLLVTGLSAKYHKDSFKKNLDVWSLAVMNHLAGKLGISNQIHELYSEFFHFKKGKAKLNSLRKNIQEDLQSIRSQGEKFGSEVIMDLNYVKGLKSISLIKEVYSTIEKDTIALTRVPGIENFTVPILRDTSNITFFDSNPLPSEPRPIATQPSENQLLLQPIVKSYKSEIEQWEKLRSQIRSLLNNQELKKFIVAKDEVHSIYLTDLYNDPVLTGDNNSAPSNFVQFQKALAFLEDHAKKLEKQSAPSSSTYKAKSPTPQSQSSDSPKTTSLKPNVALATPEIQESDDVRDSPAKKPKSKRARKPIPNKILTELSEPESDSVENTELHTAIIKGNTKELKTMLEKQKDNLGLDEFKSFINEGNLDGNRPLHFAVRANHSKVVKMLIRESADVNCKNNLGERPLHKAARLGYVNLAKVLVKAGAEIDAFSYKKNTALHYACDYLQVTMVEYLISLKANIGIENQQHATVLELLNGKQPLSEAETIKKMLHEYQAKVIAKKIAHRFRVICKLNRFSSISLTKKTKKGLLKSWVSDECKGSTKFCEWTATPSYRISDDTIEFIAKTIDKKTQEFDKEFDWPDLIKSAIKTIVEQTISEIKSQLQPKKTEITQSISNNTTPAEEPLVIRNFKSFLKEGLYASYIYYSLIIAEITSNPSITNHQLLEILKNISPLIIGGAGQIISALAPSLPGLQTGIQQGANIASTLTPIAINQIEVWLTKRDNKKRQSEAKCFVNAFIDKSSSPISFITRSIFRIDHKKLDGVVTTMTERFEEQLLDLQPFHGETLAQYLQDRIVKHLLDNRDQFEGESNWQLVRTVKDGLKGVQDQVNPARVPSSQRLDLNKRCLLAIEKQGMGATDEQVLNVHNKEVYLHGYIVWSGIKVKRANSKDEKVKSENNKNEAEYDYYGHPDEKTRAQHSLYGYCLGTIAEKERRNFEHINADFANDANNKDKASWEPMRHKGFFGGDTIQLNDNDDDDESNSELVDNPTALGQK